MKKNMKNAYIKAQKRYMDAVASATKNEKILAIANNSSVAEDELDALTDLDFSMEYNEGNLYSEVAEEYQDMYKRFVKDWGLEEPTGKPPKEATYLDYIQDDTGQKTCKNTKSIVTPKTKKSKPSATKPGRCSSELEGIDIYKNSHLFTDTTNEGEIVQIQGYPDGD